MTEQDWLTATDPLPLLAHLQGRASDRKFRLFLAFGARAVRTEMQYHGPADVADLQERFADGLVTEREVKEFYRAKEVIPLDMDVPLTPAWQSARSGAYEYRFWLTERGTTAVPYLCNVVRCIFGNPFRLPSLGPAGRTPTVVALATAIYADRSFDDLPVLADALEEAGSTDAILLQHLRGGGPHVRGGFALDLVLGRE